MGRGRWSRASSSASAGLIALLVLSGVSNAQRIPFRPFRPPARPITPSVSRLLLSTPTQQISLIPRLDLRFRYRYNKPSLLELEAKQRYGDGILWRKGSREYPFKATLDGQLIDKLLARLPRDATAGFELTKAQEAPDWFLRAFANSPGRIVLEIPGRAGARRLSATRALGRGWREALRRMSTWRDIPKERIQVVNLLPTSRRDAKAWQLNDEASDRFAAWGKKLQRLFGRLEVTTTRTPASRQSVSRAVNKRAKSKDLTIIIAENGADGVRIPGTSEVLRPADLNLPEGHQLLVLSCDAAKRWPGVAVAGSIYTNQSYRVLTLLLERRPPATMAEFLNVGVRKPQTTAELRRDFLGKQPYWMTVAEQARAGWKASFGGSGGGGPPVVLLNVTRVTVDGNRARARRRATPEPADGGVPIAGNGTRISDPTGSSGAKPEPKPPKPDSPWWLWPAFGFGLAGGALRQIDRWRRLKKRKRADLFVRTKYFLITVAEIGLAGVVGIAVYHHLPHGPIVPLAAGAVAPRELLRLVASLVHQYSTPPVGQGPEEQAPASVIEFFR